MPVPATPTEVLKARGSWRAKTRDGEPQPRKGIPKCPAWLDKEAKKKWKELVPELKRLGLLTIVDGDALAAYCQAWAELKLATETLRKEGRVFTTKTGGYLAPHPAVAQQRSAWSAVKSFAALFGLNPSARTQLRTPAEGGQDDGPQLYDFKIG